MERKSKILDGIDYRAGRGLEIGALAWPTVSKAEGEIYFVDHVTTAELKAKYAKNPGVDERHIADIDYVWSGHVGLSAITGEARRFDYVIASHVIEHVPDFVTWLGELMNVLADRGEIRLVVPDRRFTFDYLRHETVVADVVEAWIQKRLVPSPRAIMDMVINFVELDRREAWSDVPPKVRPKPIEEASHALQMAREAADQQVYHDVHCWVFTPESFARVMGELAGLGVLRTECTCFHDTGEGEFEFFVGLRPTDDRARAIASWTSTATKAAAAPWDRAAASAREAEQRDDATQLAAARHDLDAIRASTSWQATAPLRRLKTLLSR